MSAVSITGIILFARLYIQNAYFYIKFFKEIVDFSEIYVYACSLWDICVCEN